MESDALVNLYFKSIVNFTDELFKIASVNEVSQESLRENLIAALAFGVAKVMTDTVLKDDYTTQQGKQLVDKFSNHLQHLVRKSSQFNKHFQKIKQKQQEEQRR